MFTTRKAVALIIGVFVASIGATVYNLTKPPDGGGLGRNSYGTRAHGYRGLFETLEKLNVPVTRRLIPPPVGLESDETLVIISPRQDLVEFEPEHLRRTTDWIENGGHAVVALKPFAAYSMGEEYGSPIWDKSLLEVLGLPGVQVQEIELSTTSAGDEDRAAENAKTARERVLDFKVNDERPTGVTTATLSSDIAFLQPEIRHLRLPSEELQVLELTTATPSMRAQVTVQSDNGVNYTLAATFPRGRGRLTVLSDDGMLTNYLVAKADNAVLAVNLLASPKRPLVFDEFYHGLHSRGNPLWLLTRPHYGLLFIMVVIGVAVWVWRQSVALGPPLSAPAQSRRTLVEYLDAMAGLFTRSRQKKFILQELRSGVFWSLRARLRLPPGHEKLDNLMVALEKNEPDKARQLSRASRKIDDLLAQRQRIDDSQFIEASREISRCL